MLHVGICCVGVVAACRVVLFAVCWLLVVVRRLLFVFFCWRCCSLLLRAVGAIAGVVLVVMLWLQLCVVCCMLFNMCCLLVVSCCLLCVVC